jgi:hypothetical protein
MAVEPQKRIRYKIHPGVVRSYSKFNYLRYFEIQAQHHRNHYRCQFFTYCFNFYSSTRLWFIFFGKSESEEFAFAS